MIFEWKCIGCVLVQSLNVFYFLFCRTFTQVSATWPDTDVMREELDDLQVSFFYCFSYLGFFFFFFLKF
jgi:hypothetical protein